MVVRFLGPFRLVDSDSDRTSTGLCVRMPF